MAAGGGRLYLREAGEEEVLVVHDDLAAYLDRGEAYWSDLRPLPEDLDPDSIMRISVDGNLRVDEETRMADRYTVFRNSSDGESQWSVDTGSGNVDERLADGRVDAYAARLARVEAGAFVTEPPEGVGLERPAVSIRFENESGREYVIQIGDRVGETRFYMRVRGPGVDTTEEGEPYLYTVSASRLEPLLRNRDELMPQDQ